MRTKSWTHKRHGKNWRGQYGYERKSGERVFLLVKDGKEAHAFGSFQQAKASGWRAE